MINVVKAGEVKEMDNPHGISARRLFDGPGAQVVMMTLLSGQGLKKHTTPVDVFFYVLEGRGIVEIGDESAEVSRDMLIQSPAGIPHLLENPGTDPFRFLVVKMPSTAKKS